MKISEGMAIAEAVLFAYGEPISLEKLADAIGIDKDSTVKLVDGLERKYNVEESGLCIIKLDGKIQLATRPQFAPFVKSALETRRQAPLSQAAMETLAIIAYNQPVTKAFVEQVRGIDSNYVVNSLAERGLIEDAGRLDLPGRPISYRTTDTFLRSFGLHSIAELPPLPNQEGQLDFDAVMEMDGTEEDAEITQNFGNLGEYEEIENTKIIE